MLGKNQGSAIARAVRSNFDEQVKLLSSLVKAKSSNPYTPQDSPSNLPIEKDVAELIYARLKDIGLRPYRRGVSKERFNVVADWGDKRARKILMFNGHMDTVTPEERVVLNPYSGSVRSGRLYGLGVLDMKGSLSAYIYAVKALIDARIKIKGKVCLVFVVDEESGACSRYGTQYLLENGSRAKTCIIGEPGSKSICIGHRGGYRFKVTVRGEGVHTGLSEWEKGEKGRNAILDMARVIEALQGLEIPYKPARSFAGRKPVFTFPTKVEGGSAINVVPEVCEAWGDVLLMPGNSDTQVKLMIIEKLKELGVDFEIEDLLFVPSVEIDPKEEIVEVLQSEARNVLGYTPKLIGAGPWNDAWMLIKRDIPTICGFGPNGGGEHGHDEYVELKSLRRITEVYARTIAQYLAL